MGARAGLDEGQDHRAPGAQVLRVDRRLHPLVALHLPADVDLQAGVRRVGTIHRPPQVLLRARGSREWARGQDTLNEASQHILMVMWVCVDGVASSVTEP